MTDCRIPGDVQRLSRWVVDVVAREGSTASPIAIESLCTASGCVVLLRAAVAAALQGGVLLFDVVLPLGVQVARKGADPSVIVN